MAADLPPAPDSASIADRARSLVDRMLGELAETTTCAGEIEDAIFEECQDDESGKRRDAMLAAISLPSRAKTLKELTSALKTVNEASAPQGKKAAAQEKADEIGKRFKPIGPPTLKAVS